MRGIGCMMGIEYVTDKKSKTPDAKLVASIIAKAASKGLIMENSGIYGNVIRFLSPLVLTDAQLDAGLAIYEESIKECLSLK